MATVLRCGAAVGWPQGGSLKQSWISHDCTSKHGGIPILLKQFFLGSRSHRKFKSCCYIVATKGRFHPSIFRNQRPACRWLFNSTNVIGVSNLLLTSTEEWHDWWIYKRSRRIAGCARCANGKGVFNMKIWSLLLVLVKKNYIMLHQFSASSSDSDKSRGVCKTGCRSRRSKWNQSWRNQQPGIIMASPVITKMSSHQKFSAPCFVQSSQYW